MSDLRLAAVDGEQTIEVDPNDDPIIADLNCLIEEIRSGAENVQKGVVALQVDGRVWYYALGKITVVESIGLLQMASRKVERDVRGE